MRTAYLALGVVIGIGGLTLAQSQFEPAMIYTGDAPVEK